MKRIPRTFVGATVLCLSLGFSGGAWAQIGPNDDPLAILPEIFVILDTSGSMAGGDYTNLHLNREQVVQQVLTGGYKGGPSCAAAVTGILDAYKGQIRFGFSSFDNDSCGEAGTNTYNYGKDTSKNNCTQCLGLKGRAGDPFKTGDICGAGQGCMIDVVDPGDPTDLAANNDRIQSAICPMTPNSCTPLAAALYDALYYFQNYQTEINVPDPLASCRARYVLLLSDGQEYPGETWYGTPVTRAGNLYTAGITVFVVGFGDAALQAFLDPIAMAGSGNVLKHAFMADNPADLFTSLTTILNSVLSGSSSRTETTSSPSAVTYNTAYQYRASFEISSAGVGWKGFLLREAYGPDNNKDGFPDVVGVPLEFHTKLAGQSYLDRYIYTVVSDPRSQSLALKKEDPSKWPRPVSNTPADGLYPFKRGFDDSDPLMCMSPVEDANGNGVVDTNDNEPEADIVKDYVAGKPGAAALGGAYVPTGPMLGDIFHSSPAVVPPPSASSPDYQYEDFFQKYRQRHTMVYVGANDGMLHAFVAEDTKGTGQEGKELWGFIPNNLLQKIQKVRWGHEYFVDSTPVVRDVFFYNLGEYRSVLISGERTGGNAYFALDVSDPVNPRYLWEYRTDVEVSRGVDIPYSQVQCAGSRLQTWAEPIIGQVWLKVINNPNASQPQYMSRSVMVVPGGYIGPESFRNTRSCIEILEMIQSVGSVHVIDIETGKLLKKFSFGEGLSEMDQNYIDQKLDEYYARLADPADHGKFDIDVKTNKFGGGKGLKCSEKRDDIKDPLFTPDILISLETCDVKKDDGTQYEERCCNDSINGCSNHGNDNEVGVCYHYFLKEKKDGTINVKLNTRGCGWLKDPNGNKLDGGLFQLQAESGYLFESVNATPAAYSLYFGDTISRIFVGTTKGKLWRLDLAHALLDLSAEEGEMIKCYPTEDCSAYPPAAACWSDLSCFGWRGDLFYDTGAGRPIMVQPTIALDYDRKLVVFFSSGNITSLEYQATQDYLWAVKEDTEQSTNGVIIPKTGLGQVFHAPMAFATAERVFGQPLVIAGKLLFTTYTPSQSQCQSGAAKIYGVKFDDFDVGTLDGGLVSKACSSTGTPSAPKMLWASGNPVAVVQQGTKVEKVSVPAIEPGARFVFWGKIL